MLVKRDEVLNEDGSLGYVESVFKSENILKITYFVEAHRLYIAFSRGDTYVYENISPEFYQDFEDAESNGKFFHKRIKNKPGSPGKREYGLLPYEIKGFRKIIAEHDTEDNDE